MLKSNDELQRIHVSGNRKIHDLILYRTFITQKRLMEQLTEYVNQAQPSKMG